jgi:hypothetical protein
VADLVVAVAQGAHALVQAREQRAQVNARDHLWLDHFRLRHHLDEGEAPPERQIEERNGAVGRVQRAEQVQVRRHAEARPRIGQSHHQLIRLA